MVTSSVSFLEHTLVICCGVSVNQILVFTQFRECTRERKPVTFLWPADEQDFLDITNLKVIFFLKVSEIQENVPVFL